MPSKPAAARASMRAEIAALKRERVIEAAVDLFYERGIENATLDDVAERLGVSKPFIYMNFGSKPELLAEICRRGVAGAAEALDGVLAEGLGPAESLALFARRYVAAVLRYQKHIAVYVREEKNLESGDARSIGAMRKAFFGKMSALLRAGAAEGVFDIEDPDLAALAIGGAVTWAAFWFRPAGRLPVEDIIERLARQILALAGAGPQSSATTLPGRSRRKASVA